MTDKELMQQALEALDELLWASTDKAYALGAAAITALRERLAREEQELRIECNRCGRILADVPPAPVGSFAERWRNLVNAVRDLP